MAMSTACGTMSSSVSRSALPETVQVMNRVSVISSDNWVETWARGGPDLAGQELSRKKGCIDEEKCVFPFLLF